MYFFPSNLLAAFAKFVSVIVCNTSFAPVLEFSVVCVAFPSEIAFNLFNDSVAFTPSIYTLMFDFVKLLVTSLLYWSTAIAVFVVPLNVILMFLFVLSIVTRFSSFTHSVLYFGFIVPFV